MSIQDMEEQKRSIVLGICIPDTSWPANANNTAKKLSLLYPASSTVPGGPPPTAPRTPSWLAQRRSMHDEAIAAATRPYSVYLLDHQKAECTASQKPQQTPRGDPAAIRAFPVFRHGSGLVHGTWLVILQE